MATTSTGNLSRMKLDTISVYARTAKGLKVANLGTGGKLVSLTPCFFQHDGSSESESSVDTA